MKKLCTFLLLLGLPLFLHSQVCVTLFHSDNFGLEDRENRIEVLGMDQDGDMWFGSKGLFNLVGKFDGMEWTTLSGSLLPDPRPADLAFDTGDSIWIATNKGIGVVNINTMQGRTITPSNSKLPEANVTAIAVGADNMKWIGFSTGKVASSDGVNYTVHKEWNNSPVNDVEVASDGSVWVGLGDSPGVVKYKDGNWTQYSIVKSVPAITSDQWGRVMVASADSMIIFNGALMNVVHTKQGNTLRDIAVRDNGGIWASSGQGLLVRSGKRFIPYSSNNSAVPAQVSDPIVFDNDDRLWFGYTYLIGFNGYSGTGYMTRALVQETATIQADKPSLDFCYGDSITLEAEADRPSYVWPDGTNTAAFTAYDSDTIEVAVEGDNRCFYYDTIRINAQKVYEKERVCAVSVDTNGKNIIIWEKTSDVGSNMFNIYRKLETDSFVFVDQVGFDDLSVFEDGYVDPTQQSVEYKISVVDTCGNESGRSFFHRTLHLQTSKGTTSGDVNLSWTPYIGVDFPHYIINYGPHPDSMEVLTTIARDTTKAIFTYTDKGRFDTVYYRIAVPLLDTCRPSGNFKAGTGPYVNSLSNMDDNKKLITAMDLLSVIELQAWPNPFSDVTRIAFPNPSGELHRLIIYDLSGKPVRQQDNIAGTELFLERKSLAAGYYVFELKGSRLYRGKLVIR